MVVAPAFIWTGAYFGLNVGGTWGPTDIHDSFGTGFGIPASQTINAGGVIGGAQAGYNYQIGNFVIGGELEFEGMDFRAHGSGPFFFGLGQYSRTSDADWLGTAGLRLGYAVDRLLFYAKGGAALSEFRYQDATTFFGALLNDTTDSADRWGWMIGAGVEWAFAANWTAKAEYEYIGFDRQNLTLNPIAGSLQAQIPLGIANSMSIAKVGVNFKF